MKGFWNDMIALLEHLQQQGLVRGQWRDYIAVANNLKELTELISKTN
jgi:predicted Rossmann-fold nucleotide-binding protein